MANLIGAFVVALADRLEGITPTEIQGQAASAALATLYSAPGLTIDELAPTVALSGSGTVRLIDKLVVAGLVERRRHAHDGRAVALSLTDYGKEVAGRFTQARREVIEECLAALDPSNRELFGDIAENVLRTVTYDRETADRICRLCDYRTCPQDRCPVESAV